MLAGILFFGGCQDPLISFNKDKNYLCRQWKLESGELVSTTYVAGDTIIIYYTFTADSMFVGIEDIQTSLSYEYSETITFNKDQTFTAETKQKIENTPMNYTSSGTWEFLGKDDNYDKNQRIVINYTTTDPFANSVSQTDTLIITELSKEKLTLKMTKTEEKNGDMVTIIQEKNYVAVEE